MEKRRRGATDAWAPSAARLIEGKLVFPDLNLAPLAEGGGANDVSLDRLCESILASLKLPKDTPN